MSPEPVSATPLLPAEMWDACRVVDADCTASATFTSRGTTRFYWAPTDTPAPTFEPLPAVDDYELMRSIVRHIEEAATFSPIQCWTPPRIDMATIEAQADALAGYFPRYVLGVDPAWSPDEAGIRFSEISAEAEAEMAEWDAILRGAATTSPAGAGLHGRTDG